MILKQSKFENKNLRAISNLFNNFKTLPQASCFEFESVLLPLIG